MIITLPDRWPKLGDIYLLENGIKCIFDYDDGLTFGITQTDRVRWANPYMMGVTEWLRINKARLLGNSQELWKAFDKSDITEEEWRMLNGYNG